MPPVETVPTAAPALVTESAGQSIVRALARNGVEVVFGIPGTHNLELYRGLADSAIRHVTPRHEQGAGYAADGYARSTGRPGVVITTSGPGLLNASTALGTAYADSIPVLVLSPGPATGAERQDTGWLHEVKDQRAAIDAVVARSVRCHSAADAVREINRTFSEWTTSRPRPVHIEVPIDVLEMVGPAIDVEPFAPVGPTPADPATVARAAALLAGATTPLIVAGGGSARAQAPLVALAELLGSPVVTTTAGKAAIPESHPLSGGVAIPYAQHLLAGSDVVLVVGSELAETDIDPAVLADAGTLIRLDISPLQLNKTLPATVALLGDASAVLGQLNDVLGSGIRNPSAATDGRGRAAALRSAVTLEADVAWGALHSHLAAVLPPDAIVCGDSSQVSYRGSVPLLVQEEPGHFLYPNGFATLGYAVPAAVGAKIGNPGTEVVALLGDGAFMFSVQELATAVEQRLDLTIVVVDNGGYGEIRDQMVDRAIPRIGVDLFVPDLAAIARGMGCHAVQLASLAGLGSAVSASLATPGTSVIVLDAALLD